MKLYEMTAHELSDMLWQRKLGVVELTEAYLSRIDEIDPEFANVRTKAFSGEAKLEDEMEFEKRKDAILEKILIMPEDELFKIEYVDIEIPGKAQIFRSVKCSKCGELVAEHRARVENSDFVCIPCFEDYSRN